MLNRKVYIMLGNPRNAGELMVLPDRIELSASPLPRAKTCVDIKAQFRLVHGFSTKHWISRGFGRFYGDEDANLV